MQANASHITYVIYVTSDTRWPIRKALLVVKNIQHSLCLSFLFEITDVVSTCLKVSAYFRRVSTICARLLLSQWKLRRKETRWAKERERESDEERGRIDEKRGQVGFWRKHPSIRMPGIGRGGFLNDPFTKSLRDVAWNFRAGEFSTESMVKTKFTFLDSLGI